MLCPSASVSLGSVRRVDPNGRHLVHTQCTAPCRSHEMEWCRTAGPLCAVSPPAPAAIQRRRARARSPAVARAVLVLISLKQRQNPAVRQPLLASPGPATAVRGCGFNLATNAWQRNMGWHCYVRSVALLPASHGHKVVLPPFLRSRESDGRWTGLQVGVIRVQWKGCMHACSCIVGECIG